MIKDEQSQEIEKDKIKMPTNILSSEQRFIKGILIGFFSTLFIVFL